MPKAYSYIRFSTPEQIKGDSLRRQLELSEKYCAGHGLVLDTVLKFHDLGKSGYSGEHRKAALGQFLKLIETGTIGKGSVLLIESFDRLSREEVTEAVGQFLSIIGKGIKIVTLVDNKEYTKLDVNKNPADLMFSVMIMARAHEESATKAFRLAKAWQAKRERLNEKKLTSRCPAWLTLNDDKTEFTVIAERQKVIQDIFDLKLSGKGKGTIAVQLNQTPGIWKPGSADGSKRGDGWRESYIQKILQSHAVIGEYQPCKLVNGKRQPIGDPIPDYFPSIIDKDVFYRVQDQFRQNKNKGGQTGQVKNLFSYIVKCGYCGGSMAYVDKGQTAKSGQPYLICDRARRGMDCCRTSMKYSEVENLVITYCRGLHPEDILNNSEEDASTRTLLQNEHDGITGELKIIDAQIQNLTGSIERTSNSQVRETLEKKMAENFDKKASLKDKQKRIKHQLDSLSYENTQQTLDALGELLAALQDSKTPAQIAIRLKLRNELRQLISIIKVYPESVKREWLTHKNLKGILDSVAATNLRFQTSEGFAQLKEDMLELIENPKAFRSFDVVFKSGGFRTVYPEYIAPLVSDWIPRKDGLLINAAYLR